MAIGKVAAYGGTFDPIHLGHLIVARSIQECLSLERIVFVPAGQPPHKENGSITPFAARLTMVQLATAGAEGFEVSDIEADLDPPSYTLNTVAALQSRYPEAELHWIIGADSLVELNTWYRIAELVDACRIVTARRPGWDAPDLAHLLEVLSNAQLDALRAAIIETPRIDISSTDIRERIVRGQSIQYLVPEAVRRFITEHGLYR